MRSCWSARTSSRCESRAIYQQHFAAEFAAQLDNFTRQTGLDPRKDIWELLTCSDGKSTVMMARGKFSVAELEPQLDKQGATEDEVQELHPLWRRTQQRECS